MPPILNPAPTWQPDRSDYVFLWHGCTAFDKTRIEQQGIDPTCGNVASDFGRGFYTTTLERQARQWAWERFFDWQKQNPGVTGNQPVVLRFRVRRYRLAVRRNPLDDGLDNLASLAFVLADYGYEDYWSLVQHCRQSSPTMINDHQRPPTGWYDMISGSVAAFWRQRVAMDDADQFSFHTERAAGVLSARIQEGLKAGPNGDPDHYTWFPVP